MWDVMWTDPDRELVGEHRAKKKKEKAEKANKQQQQQKKKLQAEDAAKPSPSTTDQPQQASSSELARSLTKRTSLSTRSSVSSADSPFAFLKAKSLRHLSSGGSSIGGGAAGGAGGSGRMRTSASSSLASPGVGGFGLCSTRSPLSPSFGSNSRRSSVIVASTSFDMHSDISRATQTSPILGRGLESSHSEESPCVSRHDSVFSSKYPDSDVVTAHSASEGITSTPESKKPVSLVQHLGPSSFVIKHTEVSTSPREPGSPITQETATQVAIAASTKPAAAPASPRSLKVEAASSTSQADASPRPLLPLKSPLRSTSHRWSSGGQHHNPDAWQPPEEWECAPSPLLRQTPTISVLTESLSSTALLGKAAADTVQSHPAPEGDVSLLQREVKRMTAAGPEVVLSRLRESWDGESDNGLLQEVRAEKKRWMLSTLHHLDLVRDPDPSQEAMASPDKVYKLLSLFDSDATVSYLSALYSKAEVHNISSAQTPSDTLIGTPAGRRTQHIHVPSLTPSALNSIPPSSFDLVYSLLLPSLCPSTSIVPVLRSASRVLRSGGALRLTLVDPLPCAHTLGGCLRAWLEEHLIANLEREDHFRCQRPTRLFSRWLGQAGLRGPGSAVMAAKFFAVASSVRLDRREDPDEGCEKVRKSMETKAELRSLVGRMLWTEVWGPYVTAEKMWWDDPLCVEECLQMGTFWQYQIIEGVKET